MRYYSNYNSILFVDLFWSVFVNKPIGKNVCSDVGKKIAAILELKDSNKYTGQCWRGTCATLLADSGFSVPQIKGIVVFYVT